MKIIALADIHGSLRYLKDIIPYVKDVNLTVIAGDITNFGGKDDAERIITTIKDYSKRIIAVHGNCDYPMVERYLEETDIGITWKWRVIDDYIFAGLGGSLACPAMTPAEYPERKYQKFLDSLVKKIPNDDNLILVTHEPPKNTVCDRAMNGRHVGSEVIRSFIEKVQPILVVTGHIHEGRGIDRIGRSIIVNAGPFRRGNYSIIELGKSDTVKVILKP